MTFKNLCKESVSALLFNKSLVTEKTLNHWRRREKEEAARYVWRFASHSYIDEQTSELEILYNYDKMLDVVLLRWCGKNEHCYNDIEN